MKTFKKVIIPVTASALLLGACGNSATDSKEDTIISSKAGDVKVEDVMDKMGDEQVANTSFSILLNKLLADKYKDKIDTKDIDKEVEKEQKQYGGKDQFESMLKQQKMSLSDYKEQKKLQSYQKALLNDKVNISDKEIKESTKKGSHILIKVKENKDDKEGLSDKENDFDKEKGKLKSQLIQQKVQKSPKLLTDAYKELLDEYKVDYKDRDIKKAIEDSILDPDKIKQQQQQQQQQQAMQQGGAGMTSGQ